MLQIVIVKVVQVVQVGQCGAEVRGATPGPACPPQTTATERVAHAPFATAIQMPSMLLEGTNMRLGRVSRAKSVSSKAIIRLCRGHGQAFKS